MPESVRHIQMSSHDEGAKKLKSFFMPSKAGSQLQGTELKTIRNIFKVLQSHPLQF